MIELLWLASEQGYLTFDVVQQAFSGDDLTPDDLAAVYGMLGQAGVELIDASAIESVRSATHTAAEELLHLKIQAASVQTGVQQASEARLLARNGETALSKRMQDADRETRQILYGFGFAAHEHIARAEQFLAHPSDGSFERLVADSEIRGRLRYLHVLPNLIKQVRALDQKAVAAYRKWRQAPARLDGEQHRVEFRKLSRKLRQTFPRFCYQAKVIQEMIAPARTIAATFRSSQRGLQQARRCRDSVCQMPLVDVERQTIERMEEFVRMPCEMFLRHCTQLRAAETRFQQARCELIQAHLPLVASIAGIYSNRGLPRPKLIREGISGLLRAVEKFGYRREWRFSTYAACWIRQSMRAAVAAQPRHVPKPAPRAVSEGDEGSGESIAGKRDLSAKQAAPPHPERHPDEL